MKCRIFANVMKMLLSCLELMNLIYRNCCLFWRFVNNVIISNVYFASVFSVKVLQRVDSILQSNNFNFVKSISAVFQGIDSVIRSCCYV